MASAGAPDPKIARRLAGVKNIILVLSGKGGVGECAAIQGMKGNDVEAYASRAHRRQIERGGPTRTLAFEQRWTGSFVVFGWR